MRLRVVAMIPALLAVLVSSGYGSEEAAMADDAVCLEHEAQEARAKADQAEAEAREARAIAPHEGRAVRARAEKAAHEAEEAKARAERLEVEAREARIRDGGE